MRLTKTKIIHKQHRADDGGRRRKKRMSSPIQQQVKQITKENILLSVNDDTSSESSSSSNELNIHSLPKKLNGRRLAEPNKEIIQLKQTQKNEGMGHILLKQHQFSQNKIEGRKPLLNGSSKPVQPSTTKQLEQVLGDEQQGPYFFLGDEDDDEEQEDSSQSDSNEDMIEIQEEEQQQEDDSDEEDQKKINQVIKKKDDEDDEDEEDDEDDLDQDYEAQFDDQIDIYDDNFKGQNEEEIQLEMDEYEYYQKQKMSKISIPSNFNHYQLPQKEKQDFMNILNQMYYATMLTEKKKKKKKEKHLVEDRIHKEEGEQQQKVQSGKRALRKRVLFNQTISYRLFNKGETIQDMIQQSECFEELNHIQKGKQKPIMPLQKQRIQQVIHQSESNRKTAQYLQCQRDNKKQNSIKILLQEVISIRSQFEKQANSKDSSSTLVIIEQTAQTEQRQQTKQLTQSNLNHQFIKSQPINDIFDDEAQSFAAKQEISAQIIRYSQSPPIIMQQPCQGI